MWNFFRKILAFFFPWCFPAQEPVDNSERPTEPLLGLTDEEQERGHDAETEAHLSSPHHSDLEESTTGIQRALSAEMGDDAADAKKKPERKPSKPEPLNLGETARIIAAASNADDAYLDALEDSKQIQATDAIMASITTSFQNISEKIDSIKKIAKEQQQENYSQHSHAEQLSTSWNSLSRDILRHRNSNEKSITYRCNELKAHATDSQIKQLIKEIKTIFATCKKMLSVNLFRKQSLASNLKDAHRVSEENATTSEGAFFNNANRKTQAILNKFNAPSDEEDARFTHQPSEVQMLGK
jgi:archaellum component FlaC